MAFLPAARYDAEGRDAEPDEGLRRSGPEAFFILSARPRSLSRTRSPARRSQGGGPCAWSCPIFCEITGVMDERRWG